METQSIEPETIREDNLKIELSPDIDLINEESEKLNSEKDKIKLSIEGTVLYDKQFECDICNSKLKHRKSYNSHMKGPKHKRKVAELLHNEELEDKKKDDDITDLSDKIYEKLIKRMNITPEKKVEKPIKKTLTLKDFGHNTSYDSSEEEMPLLPMRKVRGFKRTNKPAYYNETSNIETSRSNRTLRRKSRFN